MIEQRKQDTLVAKKRCGLTRRHQRFVQIAACRQSARKHALHISQQICMGRVANTQRHTARRRYCVVEISAVHGDSRRLAATVSEDRGAPMAS